MLTEQDSLLVTNESDKAFQKRYAGRLYGFPPGVAVHVPFEVVRIHFGDPRSGVAKTTAVSEDGREKIQIASRADERNRLETLYGVSAEILRRQIESRAMGRDLGVVTLQQMAPKITVQTVEGTPVDTVISDPTGQNPVALPVDLSTPDALNARVAQMQQQLDQLMAQAAAATAHPDDADVTADTPPGGSRG
jgi:hypothetical protein